MTLSLGLDVCLSVKATLKNKARQRGHKDYKDHHGKDPNKIPSHEHVR